MRTLKTIAQSVVNLLYPLHCLGCQSALESSNEFRLCDRCIASIRQNAMPPFELETSSVMAYSALLYDDALKELVHSFKYKGKTALAKVFSKFMIDCVKENPEIAQADIITVVPLGRKRLRKREFNQSLLLANPISQELSLPLKNTLEKIRVTKNQNELPKNERHVNLKNAFKVRVADDIAGADILLIDDIMTTGATLNECARTLLGGGARRVTCLTLARGIS